MKKMKKFKLIRTSLQPASCNFNPKSTAEIIECDDIIKDNLGYLYFVSYIDNYYYCENSFTMCKYDNFYELYEIVDNSPQFIEKYKLYNENINVIDDIKEYGIKNW